LNTRLLIVVLTLGAVIISALGVVYARHQNRQLDVHLSELENHRDDIIAEWSRLQLEQAWLGDAGNIESAARDQLGMSTPASTRILVIQP
jgi:cell division protein FtsL